MRHIGWSVNATLRDDANAGWNLRKQVTRGSQVDAEVIQIAIVDSYQIWLAAQRRFEIFGRVHLDQGRHPQFIGYAVQIT